MVLAYHGVNLPVANTGFFGNDDGALVNTDTVSDLAAFILMKRAEKFWRGLKNRCELYFINIWGRWSYVAMLEAAIV